MAASPQWSYRASDSRDAHRTTLSIQSVVRAHEVSTRMSPDQNPCSRDTSRTVIMCRFDLFLRYLPDSRTTIEVLICPPAPRIPLVNLPGHPFYSRPLTPESLFPINLSQLGLSSVQTNLLSDLLPAFTTISVHDASNRVLCSIQTGSDVMTTSDFAEFLQHLVRNPLPSYADLSPVVRESVKLNFISRHGWQGHEQWDRFVRGTPRFGVPTGLDLLLGNTVLWMLDLDARGVWIATVDVPRAAYYT
ncbi:hypothetical protein B0H11DRAFT_2006879 [Mycena galericulata]|nr:hypothetical protein B0H11DRAFT_2006879 [Mycena galericulata]